MSNEIVAAVRIFPDVDEGAVVAWCQAARETVLELRVVTKYPLSYFVGAFADVTVVVQFSSLHSADFVVLEQFEARLEALL